MSCCFDRLFSLILYILLGIIDRQNPEVTNVTGCPDQDNETTTNCATDGGIVIEIYATNLFTADLFVSKIIHYTCTCMIIFCCQQCIQE